MNVAYALTATRDQFMVEVHSGAVTLVARPTLSRVSGELGMLMPVWPTLCWQDHAQVQQTRSGRAISIQGSSFFDPRTLFV